MYCPECGNDAGDANFCADCGTDLRDLVAESRCQQCGTEVTGGRFCPECGASLEKKSTAVPSQARTRPRGDRASSAGKQPATARSARTARRVAAKERNAAPQAPVRHQGLSPALLWGGVAVVVVVAVLVVVLTSGGSGSAAGANGSQAIKSVSADTSGSYGELVQRANGLYDQGAAAFKNDDTGQATAYFRAAARVYGAAWKKQSTDPNVGTDYATSLFYSGKTEAAIKQVDRVLAQSPAFQTAWYNKGNYLAAKAQQAQASGESKVVQAAYVEARAAYQKAISIDGTSQVATQARQQLGLLPQ